MRARRCSLLLATMAVVERGAAAARGPAERRHFACFDGYRAVAACAIVMFHVAYVSGLALRHPTAGLFFARMDVGVPLFFVISGFLLYRPFVVAHLAGRPAPLTKAFLARRLLRIVPAYWAALAVVVLIGSKHIASAGDAVIYFGFLQIYDSHHLGGGIPQAWSLCTEMTFYLALPVYAWAVRRAAHGRRAARAWRSLSGAGPAQPLQTDGGHAVVGHAIDGPAIDGPAIAATERLNAGPAIDATERLNAGHAIDGRLVVVEAWAVAAVFAGGLAVRAAIAFGDLQRPFDARLDWLPATMDLFAIGMALAVAVAWEEQGGRLPRPLMSAGRHPWLCWTGAAAAYVVVSVMVFSTRDLGAPFRPGQVMGRQVLYGVIAVLFVIPGVVGDDDRTGPRRLLSGRVITVVGLVSYGIYLVHNAVIDEYISHTHAKLLHAPFASLLVVAVVGTALAAAALHLGVERPALSLKRRLR